MIGFLGSFSSTFSRFTPSERIFLRFPEDSVGSTVTILNLKDAFINSGETKLKKLTFFN